MRLKWIIPKNKVGFTVLEYLRDEKQLSRRMLKQLKRTENGILKNGVHITVRGRLCLGDELSIALEEAVSTHMEKENIPLDILYEDDDVLVVNKEPGMLTIPTRTENTGTLANAIMNHYARLGLPYTVHIVTRLDRETSGLVLVAKHRYAHGLLAKEQKSFAIKRMYEALVIGQLDNVAGSIKKKIARDPDSIIKRKVMESGQSAITHYEVTEATDFYSKLLLCLETGRTHQIRVHLAAIGHPLIGDTLYGNPKSEFPRQALHCKELHFRHPFTNEKICIKAELAKDIQAFMIQNQ